MARKRNTESEIVLSAAAVPARSTRRAPAKTASRTSRAVAAKAVASPAIETVAPVAEPVAAVASYQPNHHEIAKLAFTYWMDRGCQGGSAEADWLRAEAELRSR